MPQARKKKKSAAAAAPPKQPAGEAAATHRPPSARQLRRERALGNKQQNRQELLLLCGVLAITAAAFFNSLDGQFVYDDRLQILKNPTLNTLANIPRMFVQSVWQFLNEADRAAAGPYYRPIFNIALIIDRSLFGLQTFGWHVSSLLIHLAAVYLVYRLARQWELTREVALAAALLFGLHPVHSESVAWVAALPDPLAAVFLLSALLLYERHYHGQARSRLALAASVLLAFAALLSKEVAIAFPLFLVTRELLDRLPGERIGELILKTARRTAPYFAAIAVYLGARYAVLGFLAQNDVTTARFTQWNVLLTIPAVFLRYTRMLFVPYPLAVVYDSKYVESSADPRFWAAALGAVAILTAAAWLVRSSTAGRRALVFAVLFLLPVLNLRAFRPQESLLHDRYLYLPSVAFCILIAMGAGWLAARFGERERAVFASLIAVVAVSCFLLTFNQNLTWQSEAAMTENALRVTPNWPFLHNYIGAYAFEQNRYADAERAYNDALAADPNYYDALSNLGDIYRVQKRWPEAERTYLRAIAAGSPYADTYFNLAVVYTSQLRYHDAEQPLQQALEIQPSKTDARYNLGYIYGMQGKTSEAEQAYSKTLEYKPSYPEPRINLGILLTGQGRLKEAIEQLLTAQRYAPDHPVMLYALGDAYYKAGRYDDAIAAFTRLSRRDPQVYTGLGLCYEGKGDKEQARANYQRAIEVAPEDPYANTARQHLAKL